MNEARQEISSPNFFNEMQNKQDWSFIQPIEKLEKIDTFITLIDTKHLQLIIQKQSAHVPK